MIRKQEIWDSGQQRLARIAPATEAIGALKRYLADYEWVAGFPDDAYMWLACTLALESVHTGNFGVGSVLVDGDGHVLVQGHNQVFNPHFRSDRHAEMVVVDGFEDACPATANLEGHALYTSLEPCPMCLVRLSTSGIARVLFAAPDMEGGMVQRLTDLPPFWVDLARRKDFTQARCSQELINAALGIFLLNLDELMEKIRAM